MTQPLVILGTGGNALDILDVVDALNDRTPTWQVVGYLDDAKQPGTKVLDIPVLGPLANAAKLDPDTRFVNAIGSDKSFRRRPDYVAACGVEESRFATLVHPAASVSKRALVGVGACVNAGVVLAGGVTVGKHVWLGSGCIVGHDTAIDDFAMIAPRAVLSGFVHVGRAAYIGGGACVRQRSQIGERSLIGLGGVVIGDVVPNATMVGNPARVLVRVPRPPAGQTQTESVGSLETPPPKQGI